MCKKIIGSSLQNNTRTTMTNHAEPSVFAKCIYDKGNKLSNAFYAFTHSYNVKVIFIV